MPPSTSIGAMRFNFANNYVDSTTFPVKLWQRYLNHSLKNETLLAGYGEAQGENKLRMALTKYSTESRGVICSPEQIVIGAGVQSLLQILIELLKEDKIGRAHV